MGCFCYSNNLVLSPKISFIPFFSKIFFCRTKIIVYQVEGDGGHLPNLQREGTTGCSTVLKHCRGFLASCPLLCAFCCPLSPGFETSDDAMPHAPSSVFLRGPCASLMACLTPSPPTSLVVQVCLTACLTPCPPSSLVVHVRP